MLENAKIEFTKNKKQYIAGLVAIGIIFFIWICYGAGFRITNNLGIGRIGYADITVPLKGTSVFIDESQRIVTQKDNEVVTVPFTPSFHEVIISRDGYFPWAKSFTMKSNSRIAIAPILISQNASGQIITKNDPEYTKLRNLILADKLPTKTGPRVSRDGTTSIWIENNSIFAKKGDAVIEVITPQTPVRNLYFYKDRNDAVIFSTDTYVYMIETQKVGTQNFIPIYKGTKPSLVENDPNSIYVLDGESLMQVVI